MIRKTLFPLLFILSIQAFAQSILEGTSYSHFQIKSKKDTIGFVIADTNLNVSKPLLLFCQGSLPTPLFIDFPGRGITPTSLNNFDIHEMNKYYHVAVISMPKTPIIAGMDHLNKAYSYVLDTTQEHSCSPAFVAANYLENYVNRAQQVLKFLGQQKWINSNQLVIAGHSQGAHIAVEIAVSNKNVTQLGLFGYNPLGRIDQAIRMLRKQAEAGTITWEQADSIQLTILRDYERYFNPDLPNSEKSEKSWASFSKSQLNTLINLKIPVYIAYGSHDSNSDLCDLLPLYFIEQQKTNYKRIRYPNVEHNFFPVDENGKPDHQNGKWKQVMNEFIKWTKE